MPLDDAETTTGQHHPVPLVDLKSQYLSLQSRIEARIHNVLQEGNFILGPEVDELEDALKRFANVGHAICVANGTDALRIALMAAGIGPGDAVFVPAFTFVATAEVVVDLGARPVFVDIDPQTFNIDPDHLLARIEETIRDNSHRPRAVIPVDLFGRPADYDRIAERAEQYDMFVLSDAAQSFGASVHGRRVGTLAAVTTTSFYPSKTLGCYADGGCIFTDEEERAGEMRCLARHGFGADGFSAVRIGMNSRLDTIQAAILLTKLEIFEDELNTRRRIAGWYETGLAQAVITPGAPSDAESAWCVYSVLSEHRDRIRESLAEEKITTAIYYSIPLHLQPAYTEFGDGPGSLPATEFASRQIFALPMHPYLDRATVDRICEVIVRTVS